MGHHVRRTWTRPDHRQESSPAHTSAHWNQHTTDTWHMNPHLRCHPNPRQNAHSSMCRPGLASKLIHAWNSASRRCAAQTHRSLRTSKQKTDISQYGTLSPVKSSLVTQRHSAATSKSTWQATQIGKSAPTLVIPRSDASRARVPQASAQRQKTLNRLLFILGSACWPWPEFIHSRWRRGPVLLTVWHHHGCTQSRHRTRLRNAWSGESSNGFGSSSAGSSARLGES